MEAYAFTHIFVEELKNASEQCLADVIQLNSWRGSDFGVIQSLSLRMQYTGTDSYKLHKNKKKWSSLSIDSADPADRGFSIELCVTWKRVSHRKHLLCWRTVTQHFMFFYIFCICVPFDVSLSATPSPDREPVFAETSPEVCRRQEQHTRDILHYKMYL